MKQWGSMPSSMGFMTTWALLEYIERDAVTGSRSGLIKLVGSYRFLSSVMLTCETYIPCSEDAQAAL